MPGRAALLVSCLLVAGCPTEPAPSGIAYPYEFLVNLPEGYENDPQRSWPLLLFLHGAGQRGDVVKQVRKHGPPKLIWQGRRLPFITVSPQVPENDWWNADLLGQLLDRLETEYRIDEDRVYVTGLSMGGYGTWAVAVRYSDRFAAIAPVSGGGDASRICAIGHLPVWAFHGALDQIVPPEQSQAMVDSLEACGGDARLTVYPGKRHDAWTETYENQELYDWFLSHVRGE